MNALSEQFNLVVYVCIIMYFVRLIHINFRYKQMILLTELMAEVDYCVSKRQSAFHVIVSVTMKYL